MKNIFGMAAGVAIIIALLLIAPLLCIWALNTISEQSGMGWNVPHNFWTYLSIFILVGAFGRSK